MIKLMKYDYDSLPEDWKKKNPNKFEGITFAYLGEVENMNDHVYYQDIKTGKPYILDIDSMKELTEDEL